MSEPQTPDPFVPVVDHVTLVVRDLAASTAFYTAALAPLGIELMRSADTDGATAYGRPGHDDFSIVEVGEVAATTTAHVASGAPTPDAVDRFHAAAVAAGGRSRLAPGIRTEYSTRYYAAFVTDPDGNNIEAVHHG
ncbi:MAG: VOC family protein [Pseudonocardiaceae bacterium]|nr:MAG: VOC family protein [Pseudonocardiaceae bacterium]